ncbi:hypothetical protein [Schlesneria paludicola]|uniref:hypothetical protein n=1 Tax=Schlesneria paludicola TaxID=360056 RepID=UPI0012FAAD8A|nr:hypothetical protein [Schlesneria paludicola]
MPILRSSPVFLKPMPLFAPNSSRLFSRIRGRHRRGVICRAVVFVVALWGSLPVFCNDEPVTEKERRSAAVALNYSRASLHRIRRNPSVRVMLEEQEKILNHLDLNGIADEEVMKLYSSVLDEISQVQIADRERVVLRERYNRAFQRDLGINAFEIAAQVATANYVSAVRTGANSWWDHRNQAASHELDIWQVDKKRMNSVVEKSSQFLDVSWKMARAKKIPDRWLVRNDDLDKLEQAQHEADPGVRLRVLKRMEGFMECYPPYLYYVARTQQSVGQLIAANDTYQKLESLGDGHFRKDEMLAAGLANRAIIQSFLSQPSAPDIARKAMDYSSEAWEANLICANVLQKHGRYVDAEDAILRNLDVNLEKTQSRIALLGLYYTSDNKDKLAAQLQDPDWVKDIPARQLVLCAAKIGQRAVPPTVIDQLSTSLQATPRMNVGRDDFVVAVGPTWQIQNAAVTLNWGDRTFSNPRVTGGRDTVLLSFDGIAEFGNPLSPNHDPNEISLSIKYQDAAPLRMILKSKSENHKVLDVSNITLAGRRHPVYRVISLEQNDLRLSLLQETASLDSYDAAIPSSRASMKLAVPFQEDPSNDDTDFVSPQ